MHTLHYIHYIHTCIHTYIHTCVYTYIHAYMHTHALHTYTYIHTLHALLTYPYTKTTGSRSQQTHTPTNIDLPLNACLFITVWLKVLCVERMQEWDAANLQSATNVATLHQSSKNAAKTADELELQAQGFWPATPIQQTNCTNWRCQRVDGGQQKEEWGTNESQTCWLLN